MQKTNIPIFLFFIFSFLPVKAQVWNIPDLKKVPRHHVTAKDSVASIIYEGLTYRGRPKEVFAYYCTPGLLTGDLSKDKDLPAMVLVHGGGGTAFREWACLWASKGYAAIAMDLRGFGEGRQPLEYGFREPPAGTPYFASGDDTSEHWLYQAVGDVMLAHSLVRSFAGVDSSRTALTGISWGGVITCMVAGLDNRFKAFAPVYGCGYLYEHSAMTASIQALPPDQYQKWVDWYDPSNYVGRAKHPVLFVNGTNDFNFFLDSYKKTYSLVKDYILCIKPEMKHGHRPGWNNEEIFVFMNSILNGQDPLPRFTGRRHNREQAKATIQSPVTVLHADLHYTTDTCDLKLRKWKSIPAGLKQNRITARIPDNTTMWFLSVTDERNCYVSGDITIN